MLGIQDQIRYVQGLGREVGSRIKGRDVHLRGMVRMAIFASGSGSNAQVLMEHFRGRPEVEVALVGCDQPKAHVLDRAWSMNVPTYLFNGKELKEGVVQRELEGQGIGLVVLAGFMRLLPPGLVRSWPDAIVNIHPSLLPKYGGQGMYGARVHQAVIDAREQESGITIHLVNERYDEGRILAQEKCPVLPGDDAERLAARIHALEHAHYPRVVEALALRLAQGG
jgi:phosphoribosylglycinamide formyltransferase-1